MYVKNYIYDFIQNSMNNYYINNNKFLYLVQNIITCTVYVCKNVFRHKNVKRRTSKKTK